MGKRVLVTGSEGFTGRYVVAELEAAGYDVWGLGSRAESSGNYLEVDLLEAGELKRAMASCRPDVVIHLAGISFVGHSDPDAVYHTNLIGTRHLLEAIAECGKTPECILLASSANVYGNQHEGVLSEETPTAPVNDYAVSKLAMEYMAQTWCQRLPIIITRPFNYTGVGQPEHFLLPKIVSHFRNRAAVLELGNLDVWRDFSDVRSVARAYHRLIELVPEGKTFNIAAGKAYSLREILSMCSDITGHKPEVRVNPEFVRANEVKMLCGDASRLEDCIGEWRAPGLRETLEWMLVGQ